MSRLKGKYRDDGQAGIYRFDLLSVHLEWAYHLPTTGFLLGTKINRELGTVSVSVHFGPFQFAVVVTYKDAEPT